MMRWLGFVVLSALLASVSPSLAQETTGTIEGTVRDASRAVLPGVTVTVAGPAIMGLREVATDERGIYTVRSLPPGEFEVRAALAGFAPMVRQPVEVRVGQTATINFDMSVAGVTETTVVRAEAPVVDLRRNSRNFTIDTAAISLIPLSTSQQYTDFWVMAPGVRDSLATATGSQSPSINGASSTQNKVFVDGIDVGDHVNASTTTFLNNAIIQEVAIATGGVEAQTGFGTGGVMNIVTKSGGNQYRGGASLFLTPKRFNGTNFPGTSPANVESYYPEGHLGGPIVRDRLWFFASEKYLYENVGIFNVTSYKSKIRSHEFYAKSTYQPHQRHRLAFIFQHDRRLQDPSFGTPSFKFDATPVGHFGGYTTGVNWDYQMGSKTLLAVVASYFDKPNQTDGRNGRAPRTRFANAAGSVHTTDGNYDRDQSNEQTRPYFSGVLTRSFSALGGHDLKLSTELYPRTSRLNRLRLNIIETYRDSPTFGPNQLWTVETPRPLEGADNDTIDRGFSFGVQDAWRPIRRLTLNGGVRYETNRTEIEGRAEKLLDFSSWSPRIGAAFEVNDKTVVKSSVSRVGEKFALDFAFGFFPNRVVYDTATSSQVNGVLDVFTTGPSTTGTTTARNVNRSVPSAVDYLFSVQRQLPMRFALDVSYVHRQFGQFNDSIDRNLIVDIPNRTFSRVDPNFDALLDTTGTDRVKRNYRTLQVWLNKRLADRWQFNGSYTYGYTRQEGEFGYYTTGNAALQFAYGDRAREFFETEQGGRHNLKLSGSYTLPFDMTAGVYFSKFSDSISLDTTSQFAPGTLAPRIILANGRSVPDLLFNPVVLVAPPSEKVGRKIGGTDLLNLQLQKGFKFGRQQLRVTAMAYNLTNEAARLGYSSTYVGNPNYNNLFGVQRPRAGQLSFGWEF